MSKILSLDSIKTCLQKLKEYVDTKATALKTDIDGRVPKTQVATQNGGPGIVSIKDLSGIKVTNGSLSIDEATAEEVQQQTNHYSPITPGRLPDVFKTYGIENEQEVPILKQTIGYESRNLFDCKKGMIGDQYTAGLSIDLTDEIHISGNKQANGHWATWYWIVWNYLDLTNKRVTQTITGTGTDYLKVCLFDADNRIVEVSGSIVTDSTRYYNRIGVYVANNDAVSNIDARITISVTDEHISDTTFYPYTPTVNDRLLALENLDAPVIAKKYKLNNAISFEAGKLGQRVFQEKIPVSVDGYTPVCSCVSYVVHSESYNPITFLSGDKKAAYVNAYAATNERHTETEQMEVTVTFISNEYCQGITTVSSDEPSLEGPSFETEQRYLEEEPSYE